MPDLFIGVCFAEADVVDSQDGLIKGHSLSYGLSIDLLDSY